MFGTLHHPARAELLAGSIDCSQYILRLCHEALPWPQKHQIMPTYLRYQPHCTEQIHLAVNICSACKVQCMKAINATAQIVTAKVSTA